MKKVLSILLAVCLLCGCTSVVSPTQTQPRSDVLDQKVPLDTLGSFFDTGIALPEGHKEPNLCGIGEDLLLLSVSYQDVETCQLILHRLDTYSGQVVSQATLTSVGYATAQVFGDTVCLCSPPSGKVWILNGKLETQTVYTLPGNYGDWYVSQDMKTLYQMGWDIGLCRYELETGDKIEMLPAYSEVSYRAKNGTAVAFSYVDPKTQLSGAAMLDLSSGQIRTIRPQGDISGFSQEKSLWLATQGEDEHTCLLGGDGRQVQAFTTPDSFSTLTDRGEILSRNYQTGCAGLYDDAGKLLTRLQLPMGEYGPNAYVSDEMIWNGDRGGYFLIYTTIVDTADMQTQEGEGETESRLAFWQLHAPVEEGALPLQAVTSVTTPSDTTMEKTVMERAKALSERFGVGILIGDQCAALYENFEAEILTDPQIIDGFLNELEKALACYPENFFAQLRYDKIQNLEFSVVGKLNPLRDDESGDIAAFAQPLTEKYIIVADARSAWDTTVHHELSHVIDHRLEWDANHSEGALYSETRWTAMNPKSFSYDMTYALHHNRKKFNDQYFISSYACSYPTEDRATVFEQAMVGNDYPFRDGPLRQKLKYYCACIKDCFDTADWPEILPWEKVLA